MKELNLAAQGIPPSGIRKFFDLVSRRQDIISLGVGEPDFSTPWHIRDAVIDFLHRGHTSYSDNRGTPALRNALSDHLNSRYGLSYEPDRELLITVGVSEALDLAMRALLNPGEEVVIPEPCYVSYSPCVICAGGRPVGVPSRADRNFRITAGEIASAITPRTKAILLSYPTNPTGATLDEATLKEIARLVEQHDLYVISDEIYDRLSYDSQHVAFPTLPGMRERTIYLNGFSKAYAMTGWRVGYAAGPAHVIGMMVKIHQYTILCADVIAQNAALEALRNGEPHVEEMAADYNRRRRFFVDGLNKLGLECPLPGGAFYAFPDIRSTGLTSEQFAERLLEEAAVATVPGNVFGACAEGFIRCSYATSMPRLREALQRIERFLSSLPGHQQATAVPTASRR